MLILPTGNAARAFLPLPDYDGESSGIVNTNLTNLTKNADNFWYTLDGRRIDSSIFNSQSSVLKKGVYIHGGRKVIVK